MSERKEWWADVPGYEDRYQISTNGRLRRIRRNRQRDICVNRILKPRRHPAGYVQYTLSKDGKPEQRLAHDLVMCAFVGERPDSHDINHKDGVPTNNFIGNLEYCTHQQNLYHAAHTLGRGPMKLKREQVIQAYVMYKTQDVTLEEVGQLFGVTGSAIHSIIARKTWKHLDLDAHLPARQLALPLPAEAA